jgi:hypothetical protein
MPTQEIPNQVPPDDSHHPFGDDGTSYVPTVRDHHHEALPARARPMPRRASRTR